MEKAGADLVALAGFMRIIPDDFVAKWEGRMINIHPSLLPRHKGLNSHEACLAAGDKRSGATVHLVTPELDSGDILGQVEVAVLPNDTPDTLAERVLVAEHQLYPRVLSQYLGRTQDFEWITGKVGELALTLPETSYQTSHGSPGWKVGARSSSKFFAIMWNRHHGEESIGMLVKCSGQDEMAQLIEAEPGLYFRPAYYGPSDWIGIALDRPRVDWDHVAAWLQRSWQSVAPPRLTKLRAPPTNSDRRTVRSDVASRLNRGERKMIACDLCRSGRDADASLPIRLLGARTEAGQWTEECWTDTRGGVMIGSGRTGKE
jgi:phosphoribosylglycinamide formyltransferase-1